MPDVLFARGQMALSLAFHIVFAAVGVAMPVLMVAAEILWRRTGDPDWLALTRRWAKGTAVLFAVGAVSGTVLSFELGLLFPTFMRHAGPVIGMPFSLEGFAFFTEAIFLGIYLYGWERVRPALHVAAGVVVAASGLLSALFVTLANAWMNAPRGFTVAPDGRFVDVDPVAAMTSPFAVHEVLHSVVAYYMVTAFGVAGIHALALWRHPSSAFHHKALRLALWMAAPAALVQPLVGHFAGQRVAALQPMKLAAMERLVETRAWAPASLGPVEIPGGLSVLAHNRPDAVVRGLSEIPVADWPHPVVHVAFQVMVLCGLFMAAVAAWVAWRALRYWWAGRRRGTTSSLAPPLDWARHRIFLLCVAACAPLGVVALEAGWVVTEVGRQPWIVYGVMRTADAVTPMPGLVVPFVTFAAVYAALGAVVAVVLWRHVRDTLRSDARPDGGGAP